MDFCITDTTEEEMNLSNVGFFTRNAVTFIDFNMFNEHYLTSYDYNDPTIRSLGSFALQPKECLISNYLREERSVNLR